MTQRFPPQWLLLLGVTALASLTACGDDDGGSNAQNANSNTNWNGNATGPWAPPAGIPHPGFCVEGTAAEDCSHCTVLTDPPLDTLSDLPAGTVVELTGGPYEGGALTVGGAGTAADPIYLRGETSGGGRPELRRPLHIEGSHVVVEGFDIDFAGGAEGVRLTGEHLCLRHSEVHGLDPGHNSTVVYVHDASAVVIFDNWIHNNGDFAVAGEQDVHGVGATATHRLWVLDNLMHRNRGDSIQFGHQADNTLGDLYIGRNELHSDGENGVDIKEASNVVISGNLLHHPAPGMPAVVLHDCPLHAAVLDNTIFAADTGVSMASLEAVCDDDRPVALFVLRNTFHDLAGNAIEGWGSGKRYYVAGNTFAAVGTPISLENEEPGSVITGDDAGLAEAEAAFQAIYGWSP